MSAEVPAAEARRVLRENGHQVGDRGKLSDDQWAAYRELAGEPEGGWPSTDLPDPAPPAFADPGPGSGVDPEEPPRVIRPGGAGPTTLRGLWARRPKAEQPPRGRGKQGGGGRKQQRRQQQPAQPWHPTAKVISGVWQRLAEASGGIPPLQRILAAQAPMAGRVWEGRLRDTVVDRVVLQRAARLEAHGEAGAGMIGVPLFVFLLATRGRAQMAVDPETGGPVPLFTEDGNIAWEPGTEASMVLPLKYCLAAWLDISDRFASEIIEEGEATIRRGKEAERLITWIFTGINPTVVQPQAAPPAGPYQAGPEQPGPAPYPGGSAFRPAITASVLPS